MMILSLHQLREQLTRIPAAELHPALKHELDLLYEAMRQRIPEPVSVRLPHAEIQPTIRPGGLTFVVLDQTRATKLPIARLYYYEIVEQIRSNIERRVYLEQPDWTDEELETCKGIRDKVKKIAWEDYSHLIGHHLFGSAEAES